jgi:2-hydroxy-6-oxonona-2,4-dienedioate hydrolase
MLIIDAGTKERNYMDEGSGEVIILLYGLFGSAKNFNYLVQHLKKNYRVIVPVFPFYDLGISVTIFCLTEFLQKLTEELGLKKFHLLGNSMGGHIALLYTLGHPEQVESLILSGSSGLFENGMGYSFPKRKEYEYIKAKTELTFYNPATASKELVDEIYEIVNSRKALHVLSLAKSTIRNNLERELHKIKAPCCLVWGKQDVVTPPQVAKDFKRLIPHARLYWIDECGHVPMLETPDRFNEVIDHFMSINAKNPIQPGAGRGFVDPYGFEP